jgi:DNA polymerase III subunit delta'
MKILSDIIGQPAAVRVLQQAVVTRQPSHAYLFHGPESVGKATCAQAFAAALLCTNVTANGDACGECPSCHKFIAGTHPDFRTIGLEATASGQARWEISIDQIRQNPAKPRATPAPLLTDAYYHPIVGDWKVYIIDPAHLLNEHAASALLKLLEEPPPYVVIILVTSHLARILPTLRSRCWPVGFRLVARDLIERALLQHTDDFAQARLFAALCEGRIGWAMTNICREEIDAARRATIELLGRVLASRPAETLRLAEELREIAREALVEDAEEPAPAPEPRKGKRAANHTDANNTEEGAEETRGGMGGERLLRRSLPLVLDLAITWYRDLLLVSQQSETLISNEDFREQLVEQASQLRPERLRNGIVALLETKRVLARYANPTLATEALILHLQS